VLVAWPGELLTSRAAHRVRVRVWGSGGSESDWSGPLDVEAGLLSPDDWSATWIAPTVGQADGEMHPAVHFRHAFRVAAPDGATVVRARLYATSAGINQLHLNGAVVGDTVLAPGWSAYEKRLRYETHDVTEQIVAGDNVIGAVVADGWWKGHLTWEMTRNVYGDRLGLLAQLEITWSDSSVETVATDATWRTSTGPVIDADLYNGESYDARLYMDGWSEPGFDDASWNAAERFEPAVGALVAREGPPVRRTAELPVQDVIVTPSGRTVLDFGQNLVGWVRLTVQGEAGTVLTLRHAEVLEGGELGVRPLRNARATDRYVLRGGEVETWEPAFTFHGFRYVEVDGWSTVDADAANFTAVVIHSDFERTGTFSCSHELVNRLHENVVWGMRGNFVDVPTDCPQRDERLGWTGDLQVFAPTASYLFDVAGFLADWLDDVRVEQAADGAVPLVVPAGREAFGWLRFLVSTAWADAATIVPWTVYWHFGDAGLLARQFDSMRRWVDYVRAKTGDALVWPEEFQLGDWLDPDAPPNDPSLAKTDALLIATAYFAKSAQIVGDAARVLGRDEVAGEYEQLAQDVRAAFRHEFATPTGRLSSDAVTAYSIALMFDMYDDPAHREKAVERIAKLTVKRNHRISTGFVGTPLVLPALTAAGDTQTAYRMLTQTECPSWLYPITMGATTIWERWDSMLPDGSINSGDMTSFNHYALGSVAQWLHETVGGIAPAQPGYRQIRFAPVPGRGVTAATTSLRTPYGRAACEWSLTGTEVTLTVEVPPNASGSVVFPGRDGETASVGAGRHEWTYTVAESVAAAWDDPPPTWG
jgi:alpha-L-rhamnosidase